MNTLSRPSKISRRLRSRMQAVGLYVMIGAHVVVGWPSAVRVVEQQAWKRDIAQHQQIVDLAHKMRHRLTEELEALLNDNKASITVGGWIAPNPHMRLTDHDKSVMVAENQDRKHLYEAMEHLFGDDPEHARSVMADLWLDMAAQRGWLVKNQKGETKFIS